MKIKWSQVDKADDYLVSVVSLVDCKSESIFITPNTTIQLPLKYNQDYNVSVMASNCAGNSTPAEIGIRIGMY